MGVQEMRMEGKESRRSVRKVMQVSEDWCLKEWGGGL